MDLLPANSPNPLKILKYICVIIIYAIIARSVLKRGAKVGLQDSKNDSIFNKSFIFYWYFIKPEVTRAGNTQTNLRNK